MNNKSRLGRPSIYQNASHVHVRLPDHMIVWLKRVGDGNITRGLHRAIRAAWRAELNQKVDGKTYPNSYAKLRKLALERIANDAELALYAENLTEIVMSDTWMSILHDNMEVGYTLAYGPSEAILDILALTNGGELPALPVNTAPYNP